LGGRPFFNRDVSMHTIAISLLSWLAKPAQPMLPILPILPKKVMVFGRMLSNSIKYAPNSPVLLFSPHETIHEP
jgi:hypothetical protein